MKVLIDAHMVGENEGGNERYISSLINSLGKIVEICAIVSKDDLRVKGASKSIYSPRSNWLRYLWEIPRLMQKERCELVLTTYFVSPLVAKQNIVMIHDLLPLRKPGYFSLKERLQFFFLKYSISLARAVIVPSKFVKAEIAHFYPGYAEKVFVIPEASSLIFQPRKREERKKLRKKMKIEQYAVLVVLSKYQKRPWAPIEQGLEALGIKLIVYLLNVPDDTKLQRGGMIEYRLVKHVSDARLAELYACVDLVIYGSRYEGFGLPVLEAIQSGTPLLTTKIPPIVEILGEHDTYYFDLDKPASLARQIKNLRKHSQRVYNVASRYSWDKTANKTAELFVKLSESR